MSPTIALALAAGLGLATFAARLALAPRPTDRLLAAFGLLGCAVVTLAALGADARAVAVLDAALVIGLAGALLLLAGVKAMRARTLQGTFGPPLRPLEPEPPR